MAHIFASFSRRITATFEALVKFIAVYGVTWIVIRVDQFEIHPNAQIQPEFTDTGLNRLMVADEHRFGDALLKDLLGDLQYLVLFAFGKHDGRPLDEVAGEAPDYLRWILEKDFPDDAKALVRRALEGET